MKRLEDYRDELKKCVKCGACRSICPTFRVIGRETACMRGKLALVDAHLSGGLARTGAYARHMKECTLCGGCRDVCPAGVDTTGIIAAARAGVFDEQGLALGTSLVLKNLLGPGKIMPLALKLASRIQGFFMKDAAVQSGFLSRFPLPGMGGGRLLPPLAKTFFMDSEAARRPGSVGRGSEAKADAPTVAFFAGCGVNFLMPEVGEASLKVLGEAGARVAVPREQTCCGMPAFSMGDVATARSMAMKNLEVFEAAAADFITTSCATCGYGLKTLMKELLSDDPALAGRVEAVVSRVRDVTELLAGELDYGGDGESGGKPAEKTVVTYHDPCHLNRAQGIRDEPRDLLRANPALEFRQMRFPCSCCGLGGGVGMSSYDLSIEITRRKAESIRDTGADVVATACPGCMVQLRDALHKYGVDARVAHVVELI